VGTCCLAISALSVGLLAVLAIYFCVQAFAYMEADPRYTFQASGCASVNPTNLDPIISYMQQAHIRFAWGTDWIAAPITFRTNSAILITGPHARITADILAVLHSDRPSILLLARHDDSHPAFLRALDARSVVYHAERFYSVPGVDELVVTPLNRAVSPLDPAFADAFRIGGFHNLFSGCF
jgi:hypothetical protein